MKEYLKKECKKKIKICAKNFTQHLEIESFLKNKTLRE
jgi:hypothetical protein